MIIINDCGTLRGFEAWSGAVETRRDIINADKDEEFDALIEELYPDGITDTGLNDLLWFESEWIFEMLNMNSDDNEEI